MKISQMIDQLVKILATNGDLQLMKLCPHCGAKSETIGTKVGPPTKTAEY